MVQKQHLHLMHLRLAAGPARTVWSKLPYLLLCKLFAKAPLECTVLLHVDVEPRPSTLQDSGHWPFINAPIV